LLEQVETNLAELHNVALAEIERLKDIARCYEELRSIIDGGSESMTHEDAVRALKAQPAQSEPVAYVLTTTSGKRYLEWAGSIDARDLNVASPLYAAPQPAQSEPVASRKVIGWRTENFLWETADIEKARNWEPNIGVLPIYAGDENTMLTTPQPSAEVERIPDLMPVILWLENGCDPKEAAKELRIYDEAMKKGGA
jgi:hypothetical protein